jgi:hypothetical protein
MGETTVMVERFKRQPPSPPEWNRGWYGCAVIVTFAVGLLVYWRTSAGPLAVLGGIGAGIAALWLAAVVQLVRMVRHSSR